MTPLCSALQVKYIDECDAQIANLGRGVAASDPSSDKLGADGEDGLLLSC
jgi:hypothetical protein